MSWPLFETIAIGALVLLAFGLIASLADSAIRGVNAWRNLSSMISSLQERRG